MTEIAEGLFGKKSKEFSRALKDLVDPSTPTDIAKRISMLVMGSVAPETDEELALKLCLYFPIEFFAITNKITELTGLGLSIRHPSFSHVFISSANTSFAIAKAVLAAGTPA